MEIYRLRWYISMIYLYSADMLNHWNKNTIIVKGLKDVEYLPLKVPIEESMINE